jgi:hypothetical protein
MSYVRDRLAFGTSTDDPIANDDDGGQLSESIEVEWASESYVGFGGAKQEDEFLHPERAD